MTMMKMQAASKSMDTLVRLSAMHDDPMLDDSFSNSNSSTSCADEHETRQAQHVPQQTIDEDDDIAECDLFHNVVEYHPEEVFELAPLKPEEANECELADLFASYGSDISSLFEASSSASTSTSASCGEKRSSCMIPSDWISDCEDDGDDEDTVITEFDDFERCAKRARLSVEQQSR